MLTGHAVFFRQCYMLVFFCFVRLTKKLEERREQKKMEEEEVKREPVLQTFFGSMFCTQMITGGVYDLATMKKGILHHPATIPYLPVLLKLLILLMIKFLI